MKCFYCPAEACAKVGAAKGNIWKALLGMTAWDKAEKYVCRNCFETKQTIKEIKNFGFKLQGKLEQDD